MEVRLELVSPTRTRATVRKGARTTPTPKAGPDSKGPEAVELTALQLIREAHAREVDQLRLSFADRLRHVEARSLAAERRFDEREDRLSELIEMHLADARECRAAVDRAASQLADKAETIRSLEARLAELDKKYAPGNRAATDRAAPQLADQSETVRTLEARLADLGKKLEIAVAREASARRDLEKVNVALRERGK